MEIILISGLSGSGKSVALHVLEDRGYYCVDNLPVDILGGLVDLLQVEGYARAAVAIDVRSGAAIDTLPEKIRILRQAGHLVSFLFLDTQDDTLIKRYSETRRRHPLASDARTLVEAISEERCRLRPLAGLGHHMDTSGLRAAQLREWTLQVAAAPAQEGLTLHIQSFGFKHGLPRDADLVFDARCLPNPYYEAVLRPLTGLDAPVIEFLEAEASVLKMRADLHRFLHDWLPAYRLDNRASLTVAIGCTGGQHRSVYLAEWLGRQCQRLVARVLVRHRAIDGTGVPPFPPA
ncbi:MAG: RNase adapter RapZ [Zoogloeaceae bacterium]|nr:RNase adapter RapZ [Zoogloeaceae bacterium]